MLERGHIIVRPSPRRVNMAQRNVVRPISLRPAELKLPSHCLDGSRPRACICVNMRICTWMGRCYCAAERSNRSDLCTFKNAEYLRIFGRPLFQCFCFHKPAGLQYWRYTLQYLHCQLCMRQFKPRVGFWVYFMHNLQGVVCWHSSVMWDIYMSCRFHPLTKCNVDTAHTWSILTWLER